jgi:hypothetical protein
MPSITERSIDFVVETLLFPARVPPRILTRIATTVAILLLLRVLILTLPPLKNFAFCAIFHEINRKDFDEIKNWCDFVVVACQIVIVIAIGGFVFTDGVARWMRQRSESLQTQLLNITEALQTGAQLTPRQQSLLQYQDQIDDAKRGINLRNIFTKVREIGNIVDNMYKLLAPDVPALDFSLRRLVFVPFPFSRIPGIRDNKLLS